MFIKNNPLLPAVGPDLRWKHFAFLFSSKVKPVPVTINPMLIIEKILAIRRATNILLWASDEYYYEF